MTILPADKGRATVILDTSEYVQKVTTMLSDKKTYEVLKKDPTAKIKKAFIDTILPWKKEETISKKLYKQIYPTSEQAPRFTRFTRIASIPDSQESPNLLELPE